MLDQTCIVATIGQLILQQKIQELTKIHYKQNISWIHFRMSKW